jgi:pimeloyl-ACP methyl ester carboxylesterase
MTTVVLLRGLARESGHWGGVRERLQRALGEGVDVIALDLPGNGARHGETSPASVRGLLAECRAELRQRAVQPPLVLVALSLGAMVAVQWCAEAPQELAGCVLVNTSLRGISPFWQRLRPAHWLPLLRLLAPGRSVLQRERLVLAMTSGEPWRHAGVVHDWAELAHRRPVRRGNALRQLLAAMRFTAPAPGPVPMLVLASAGDRLVDPRCSRELARRWRLPLGFHPWAGHDLALDDPQWFVAWVAGWSSALAQRHETATGPP